jgi:hypothetical protein
MGRVASLEDTTEDTSKGALEDSLEDTPGHAKAKAKGKLQPLRIIVPYAYRFRVVDVITST